MRKYLYKIFGVLIVLVCAISAGLWSVVELGLFVGIAFGNTYSDTMIFAATLTLPLLVYFWWAWTRQWSINAIKKLINYEESDTYR